MRPGSYNCLSKDLQEMENQITLLESSISFIHILEVILVEGMGDVVCTRTLSLAALTKCLNEC